MEMVNRPDPLEQTAARKPRVFISYARADDEPFAKRLYSDLRGAGVSVWWDRKCMESRGRTFLQELRDAINGVERVIAVIGPRAVESEYVLSEWAHAGLFAKGIVPVLRNGGWELLPSELSKLHGVDMSSEERYGGAFKELLRLLFTPLAPLGAFLTPVPALPARFQPRSEDVSGLLSELLCDLEHPMVVSSPLQTIVASGMGGIGKTVIAAALCRAVATRRAFEDGIIWLSLGQQPDLLQLIRRVVDRLGTELGPYTDLASAQSCMSRCLERKKLFIVLDDVWQVEHATLFLNVLSPHTRMLVTTRERGLIPGARSREVGAFNSSAALQMLADWSGESVRELRPVAKELAKECGFHPFALALCGSMRLEFRTPWEDMLSALRASNLEFVEGVLPNYETYRTILKSLQVSVEGLAQHRPEAVERYKELAVLRYELGVTEDSVATLWSRTAGLDAPHSRKLLSMLARLSLLSLDREGSESRVSMHDLWLDYLRSTTKQLSVLEQAVIDAYRSLSPKGWDTGPNDGYFFRALPHHLKAIGSESELKNLLLNYRWIKRKLEATDALALLSDYRLIDADSDLNEVHSALSNALPAILRAKEELPGQLHGRLLRWRSGSVRTFLDEATHATSDPWLRPVAFALYPAGLQLLRAIAADSAMDRMAMSESGQVVLVGSSLSRSGRLGVCDFERDSELAMLDAAGPVYAIAVSRSGTMGVASSDEAGTEIWDLKKREKITVLAGYDEMISAIAFDPDDRCLITGSFDGEVKLWDLETYKVRRTITTGQTRVSSIAVNDKLTYCLSGHADGSLILWNIDDGVCKKLKHHKAAVQSVTLSQDARHAISAEVGEATLWDLERPTRPMTFFRSSLGQVSASRDCARVLLLAGKKVTSLLLDFDDPGFRGVRRIRDVEQSTVCLAANPDFRLAATISEDNVLRLWDLSRTDPLPTQLQTAEFSHPEIYEIALTPDRIHAVARCLDRKTTIYDLQTHGFAVGELETADCDKIFGVVDTEAGTLLLGTTEVDELHLFDVKTRNTMLRLSHIGQSVRAATITPDLKYVVLAMRDGDFQVVALERQEKLALALGQRISVVNKEAEILPRGLVDTLRSRIRVREKVVCVAKGERVLVSTCGRTLLVWDVERSRLLAQFTADVPIKVCAILKDDSQVVALDDVDQLHVFRLEHFG